VDDYFIIVDDESNIRGKYYDTYFEAVVAEALRKEGMEFRHAKWSEGLRKQGIDPLLGGGVRVPDFITKFIIDGKVLVIEPHGGQYFKDRDKNHENKIYEKFDRFMREKGDRFYLVIITDMTEETLSFNLKTRGIEKIADEVWHVPSYPRSGKKHLMEIKEPTEEDVNEILQRLNSLRLRAMQREEEPLTA